MTIKRFETLDVLRGVAALGVVVYHLGTSKLEVNFAPRGYLAVDFFFVLSGFVVAHAYEAPLKSQLSWWKFFIKRLIRFYPLVILSIGLGTAVLLMKWLTYPERVNSLSSILESVVLNSLLLPMLSGSTALSNELFPTNGPLWTLSLELAANMVWAWIGIRAPTWALAVVVCLSWVAMVVFGAHFHTGNLGLNVSTFWGGVARVGFGFTLGVVIYRLLPASRMPRLRFGPVLLYAATVAVMGCSTPWDLASFPLIDLTFITVILPAIVVLGIGQQTTSRWALWIGSLSYPIYVLHMPFVLVASGLHQTFLRNANAPLLGGVTVAIVLAASVAALRLFDEPARRRLTQWVTAARPPARLSSERI